MRDEHDSFDILDHALAAAHADEADAVFISTDQNISRFANSNLHQNMSEISADLTLRVFVKGAMGVASTTSFAADDIAEMATVAREAARHSLSLPKFAGLYRGGENIPTLPTYHEANLAPAEKARALRMMFDRGREAGVQFGGSYATAASSVACGNTHGVRRYGTMTVAEATVIAIRGEDSGYATAIDRRSVDVRALGEEAIEKGTLQSGRHETLEAGEVLRVAGIEIEPMRVSG